MPDSSILYIKVPEPFNYNETVNYLRRSPNELLYQVEGDVVYRLIPSASGEEPAAVEIRHSDAGELVVRVVGEERVHIERQREIEAYIREWFDFDTDLSPFYDMAGKDPLLVHAISRFHGLRSVGISDLFEALCWGIIGQQINLAFAYTLKKRFVEAYGQSLEREGRTYWLFPEPGTIAALKTEDLTPMQMTVKKSEYLIGVAKLMAEGTLNKHGLLELGDFAAIEKQLIAIRGIGPWTANYVLMRCLRLPNAFPIADVGLHNSIKALTGSEAKPSISEIKRMAEGWKGWEAYATFYLWRILY
ncbi:DNA-3-methyladenine glycosylase family protein [Paenibacillus glycanilyticus]|uniref:DNA-3-methyladenine glycosylase II n=1 Tax=Paenibacillus glycanilyticus TaxID=126569 RepID=A0ABQ6GCX5_9BACL|nr:DNA-3-methyladenine glycosylase [Paenibacillus glycanilyticus]GLX68821.1 DNA-3-methyladenine glycosylase [Paenibacillus glycanilyticus]